MNSSKEEVPIAESLPHGIIKEDVLSKRFNCKPELTNYVTIFDYDDTLLPSSWISYLMEMKIPITNEIRKQLDAVDRTASALLSEAIKYSTVLVITNAESGWVEESSCLFMPRFHSMLSNVTIISARSLYESTYPGCSSLWKEQAFKDELDRVLSYNCYSSVLSIGDSLHEREAVFSYGRNHSHSLVKSIKLIDAPSPSHLATQQELICNSLYTLIFSPKQLDLKLSVQGSVQIESVIVCILL